MTVTANFKNPQDENREGIVGDYLLDRWLGTRAGFSGSHSTTSWSADDEETAIRRINDAQGLQMKDKAEAKQELKVGDEMEDRTILAGYYEGKPLYARPRDESGTYNFNEAAKHAKAVGGGFHVPNKGELNVLWENRNKGKLRGTFNETGSSPAGYYWSSSHLLNIIAWGQRFSDGRPESYYDFNYTYSSLRLVRG